MNREKKMLLFLFGLIVAMFLLGEMVSQGFASPGHIGNILRTASFLGIVSLGQTLAILTGGIDLSAGPLITLGNVLTCMFINGVNLNTFWAIPAILLLGIVFGASNGAGVAYLKISPLVMTLAVGSLVTGITLIFSQGAPKGLASPLLRFLGVGNVLSGLPVIVLLWAALSVCCILFLRETVFGRRVYYVGANEKAAFLSGTRVNFVKIVIYALSGASAALTGALMAGYTQTAFLGIGNEYTMWSITAVVIGGTSLTGGKGGYAGTIAGAIILILLESLLTVMKIPEAGRRIANGLIILVMITIYFRQNTAK
ncbi:ABC transporter [Candidatus Vecturithrix granuli]|uniref:ABC transporter n=1 Tax=Vecturithrix granuli TaxID=1499967 RepID=A0A081BU73_VECG1|nr:ABC transporter [Candidatus Vecturithrix granuli]